MRRKRYNSFWDLTIVKPKNFWYIRQNNIWTDDSEILQPYSHSSYQHFNSGKKCKQKAISLAKSGFTVVLHHYYWYKPKGFKKSVRLCNTTGYSPK